ncbi:hypothetical protein COY65_03070 [Candidatus Jorgensenbacteria bacterium CG_4_10_14_0_8_um_filter_39_13]|uniref:DOT1 domain-containing protein n=2 Tax=Candidatus Joergenseniibacteriota TaxID=1752739 RepID=A0A2M7RFK7_9BACT|nr:MAG: hypothetical protein COV54_02605 [Candidatus Jorgensenbacteria bacterium CG11_big_fil_rev_8_21_14_0_20_38_23]PIV13129.1 MAG: hypothetical protein COS46_01955 [Candidatus Jorgensenbacteria bacterium CG03_land_8_20_14_0_80_38_39]PIW97846.1 MAG: hypothetical protein COZ81_00415 [Candidatus Jorgensenbacteria bacterium CG_4_8_14_3_um_filter_38_10]PIY95529.1 MAG: hypothetical protein COY65_03070 [Candidatus Jorgensenbacteria bacterium CG_4_10_14_0_8_um_filter_39_13]PJA94918.1 MAG: hypothetica
MTGIFSLVSKAIPLLEFLLIIVLFFLVLMALFFYVSLFYSEILGAPFVSLRKKYLKEILKFGGLKEEDVLFDFGSGDGRVLITAVENFGIKKAVGFEASPCVYWLSKFFIKIRGLNSKIKIFPQNFLKIEKEEFEEATFVFLYLFPKPVEKLFKSQLFQLKPGTKILCVSFSPKLENHYYRLLKSEKVGWHTIYLYQKI